MQITKRKIGSYRTPTVIVEQENWEPSRGNGATVLDGLKDQGRVSIDLGEGKDLEYSLKLSEPEALALIATLEGAVKSWAFLREGRAKDAERAEKGYRP